MTDFDSILSAAQQLSAADRFRLVAVLSGSIPPSASTVYVEPAQEPLHKAIVPRDDWERRLLAIGTPCGVALPNSAFSSDELYD